jgi:hypothetical protein
MEEGPILGPRRHCCHCHQNAEEGPILGPRRHCCHRL